MKLPVKFWIKFKINVLLHKTFNGQAPPYLTSVHDEIVQKILCATRKRPKLVSMGDHAFSEHVVLPKYWNELSDDVRNIELPLDIFKKKLKTRYFKIAYYNIIIVIMQDIHI